METTAAARLEGITLDGDWLIEKKIDKEDDESGGFFSVGYHVRGSNGERAFLKALDIEKVILLHRANIAEALEIAGRAFNHELNLLRKCQQNSLNKVVRLLADGGVTVDKNNPLSTVQYLIFEFAESNVSRQIALSNALDYEWIFTCIHDTAVALRQLHNISVAHQDIRPSNILIFDQGFKVGDLGRSSVSGTQTDHDNNIFPGANHIAPIEILYGHVQPSFLRRRIGCDIYQLGGLLFTLLTNVQINTAVINKLSPEHHYHQWRGDYFQALPFLEKAFIEVLEDAESVIPDIYKKDAIFAIKNLCNPRTERRGHPMNLRSNSNSYELERFISLFDKLRLTAYIEFKKVMQP